MENFAFFNLSMNNIDGCIATVFDTGINLC